MHVWAHKCRIGDRRIELCVLGATNYRRQSVTISSQIRIYGCIRCQLANPFRWVYWWRQSLSWRIFTQLEWAPTLGTGVQWRKFSQQIVEQLIYRLKARSCHCPGSRLKSSCPSGLLLARRHRARDDLEFWSVMGNEWDLSRLAKNCRQVVKEYSERKRKRLFDIIT